MNKLLDPENINNENISEENENAIIADEMVSNENTTNEELTEEIVQDPVESDEVPDDLSAEVENLDVLVEEEPIVEEPAAEEPIVEESVEEETFEEEPIVEETVTEEPTVEDPVEEEPIVVEPIEEEPAVEESIAEELIEEEPILEETVEEEQITEEPVVEEPIAEEPIAEDPTLVENPTLVEDPIDVIDEVAPSIEPVDKQEIEQWDKTQIVEHLSKIVYFDITENIKNEIETCKQVFYKIKSTEVEEAEKEFVAQGGKKENFTPEPDENEEKLKGYLAVFRDKKSSLNAQTEKIKENNLASKKQIIEKLKELIDSKEDFYKVYNEFRKLQHQWKEIKQVPQTSINELWKEYQYYSEKFYDLLKINNEMRDYDFKKNLELKQALCEAVEKLDNEKDVISAFYQLQKLHQEWREIGPVAKEMREEIWSRFKKASVVVNKRHQEHFESMRIIEQRNLEEKVSICVDIETIDFSNLTAFKDWDEQHRRILDFQEKWKTVGFAPKKNNTKVFERFRAACDVFFKKKSIFYKSIKEIMDVNYEKKIALCEKAEELKNSQEWKEATDQFIALQKEWKAIGPVSRKNSDVIWKRFIKACDYFFEQKNTHFSSQKTEEVDNLKKKKEIIEKINAIDLNLSTAEAVAIIRDLITEWNRIGFVPFREKDRIHREYRKAVDKHFDRLKLDESERRLQTFKSSLSDISSGDEKSKNKLLNERDKLMRTYERLKSDIQTYENNIGFLSFSSKGGSGLMKEMNHKISSLKEELNLIVKKIEVIDENFEK